HLRAGLDAIGVATRAELIRVTAEDAMRAASALGGAGEPPRHIELAAAERAVVELVLEGLGNAEIAGRRGVSVRTIANQLTKIYRKVGVRDRHELIHRMTGAGRGSSVPPDAAR